MQNVKISKIVKIVRNANKIVLDIYNRYLISDDVCVNYKDDDSPLTEADLKSSDYICEQLNLLYPNIPIICEETKKLSYDERKEWDTFWLVDPVDGTKEFVNKNGEFTVNIGLIHLNNPVLGVVGVPVQNTVYFGDSNGSYLRNDNTQETIRLKCIPFKKSDKITVLCSRSHMSEETEDYISEFNVAAKLPSGSSLKFMLLCENKGQLYPRLAPTMEWDIAASHAIIKYSGGHLSQVDGSKIDYNKEVLLNPYFIASTGIIE
jgi:3'(2'), 5'-bisphosphate nucleotidase